MSKIQLNMNYKMLNKRLKISKLNRKWSKSIVFSIYLDYFQIFSSKNENIFDLFQTDSKFSIQKSDLF